MWKLNDTILSSQWSKKKLQEIRKYFEMSKNENTT